MQVAEVVLSIIAAFMELSLRGKFLSLLLPPGFFSSTARDIGGDPLLRFNSMLFVLEEAAEIRLLDSMLILTLCLRSKLLPKVVVMSVSFFELGLGPMKLLVLTAVHTLDSSLYELIGTVMFALAQQRGVEKSGYKENCGNRSKIRRIVSI